MSLADKLIPHLPQILVAQIVLMGVAILVGIALILRKMAQRGGSLEGDAGFAKERVAAELAAEITRLGDLRSRLLGGQGASSSVLPVNDTLGTPLENALAGATVPASAAPAQGSGQEASASAAAEAAALKVKLKEAEERHTASLKELKDQLDRARSDLQAQVEAMAAMGSSGEAAPKTPAQDSAPAKDSATSDKELTELKEKLKTLESVVKDYEIFEQDLALVKKYKSENDVLRKQISASHNVTEDDIAKLFTSMGSDENEKTVIPGGDDFFGADTIKTISGLPSTGGESEKVLPSSGPSVDMDPSIMVTTAESAASEPAPMPSAGTPPASGDAQTTGDSGTSFQFSAAPQDSALPSGQPEGMEELAEASVNDDKLIQEFEKILGDKPT
jgi:hypothetical protein